MAAPHLSRGTAGLAAGLMAAVALMAPLDAARQQSAGACRITGHATSGTVRLPGVALIIKSGTVVKGSTSTDIDGSFSFSLTPGEYTLSAELTGFGAIARPLTVGGTGACAQTIDLALSLSPREAPAPRPAAASAPATEGTRPSRGAPSPAATTAANATGGRGGAAGRGGQPASSGFQTLEVRQATDAAAQADSQLTATETEQAARALLPPGFSTDASNDAIAINGNSGSIDRGMLQDRFGAIGRGEFDPAGFDGGFGAAQGFGAAPGGPEAQNFGGGRGQGGPGGFGGPGGPGGRGGEGFFLGGRGVNQQRYQGTVNYTFGGSVLDAQPFQLRNDRPTLPFTRNTYGGTIGGPVKLGKLYDGTRKTNFVLTYNGNHGSSVFDQYANVPTLAQRKGDFSALGVTLINPATGQPFPNNQVPASPVAQSLLQYIPAPNLPGTENNFHFTSTTPSSGDTVNLRVTHNFTPNVAGGGRGGGRGGFGGGGRGGRGQAATGTSVNMTAQLQYRRSASDTLNVNPLLGGHSSNRSVAVPVSFNIRHKRTMHNLNVNFSETSASTTNNYSGVTNVAGDAGIYTGLGGDPFTWGVPILSFSQFQALHDVTPSRRTDQRLTLSYTWTQPWKTHQFRAGGNLALDRTSSESNASPNGNFSFTGLYTGNDFADFLLGASQQAAQQYGPGNVQLRGRSSSLFFQDDWRQSSKLTFSLGVRYELIQPYTEASNHLVTLDVNPDFTAAAAVQAGNVGPYTGAFPDGIMLTDINNVAPRVGLAYRMAPGFILRGGYGVSYNSGSYSTMARELAAQPPFASSNTQQGTVTVPIPITTAFTTITNQLQNSFGVDKNYQLGRVQTWNVDLSKDLTQAWTIGGGYTRTTGANLDVVRAPNRDPSGGLRIPDVQAFLWQTSEGISNLNAGTFRLQRRFVHGFGGSLAYTIAKSMDDASNYGGGGTVVAQNDQDLAAEYSLSSFDRRHQVTGNVSFELPFGPNKPWFHDGGFWGSMLGGWRGSATITWQTGTPLTPRVVAAARDVSSGVSGTLRANVVPDVAVFPGSLSYPQYFNPLAFVVPPVGQFGDAGRNSITGPGSHLLNAQFSRDVRMGGNRAVTLQANILNILNTRNYATVDTNVRSATFGQVLSFQSSRTATLNFRFRF
jgi:hypothetical protein